MNRRILWALLIETIGTVVFNVWISESLSCRSEVAF